MELHIDMHEYIFKPFTALAGTLAGALTFTGVLQGIGLVLGIITASFSALYWFRQWRMSVDEHKWKKEDRKDD